MGRLLLQSGLMVINMMKRIVSITMEQVVNRHDEVLHHLPHSQVSAGISLRAGVYISHILDCLDPIEYQITFCTLGWSKLDPFGGLRVIQARRSKGCDRLFPFLHSLIKYTFCELHSECQNSPGGNCRRKTNEMRPDATPMERYTPLCPWWWWRPTRPP